MRRPGAFSGYFRDDSFNAADFLAERVLPYSNQQLSATLWRPDPAGPAPFFANYEYEREPRTHTFNTPVSELQLQLTGTRRTDMAGAAGRFSVLTAHAPDAAGNVFDFRNPDQAQQTGQQIGGHPASVESFKRHSEQVFATLTQVLTDRTAERGQSGLHQPLLPHRELT